MIRTSDELAIASFTSRADASAESSRAVNLTNRWLEVSDESGSNSEWLRAVKTSPVRLHRLRYGLYEADGSSGS
jgi:hypothetical protein